MYTGLNSILKNTPSELTSTHYVCSIYVYGKRISFISVDAGGVFFSSSVLGSVIPDIFRQNLHTLAHLDAAMQ